MAYARPIAEVTNADVALVGGKGASLGEVTRLGIPVPPGFCLTIQAYQDFISAHGLSPRIQEVLASFDTSKQEQREEAAGRIGDFILQGELSPELIGEVLEAYQGLGEPPVAVRSSATAEDLPDASFAGQHDSYLNVVDGQQLLNSIKLTWSSLWSPRAIDYRNRHGFDHGGVQMAVVVQEMVSAEVSGVMFTVDAPTRDATRMLINSSFGLGEGIVSGALTPDSFTVDKSDYAAKEQRLGLKELMVVGAPSGGTMRQAVAPERQQELSLSPGQLAEVAQLGWRLERHFGGPQDVEWAMYNGKVYILQSRPLAGMEGMEEVSWENLVPGARWLRTWRIGEWLSDPVTPLFATTLLPWLVAGREKQGFRHLGWRAAKTFQMPEPWYIIVNGYFFTRADLPFRPSSANADPAERAAILTKRTGWLQRWHRKHLPRYLKHVETLREFNLSRASASGVLAFLEGLCKDAGELWYILAPIGFGFEEFFFVPFYNQYAKGQDGPHYTVFFSGYDNKVLEGQRVLYDLAEEIKRDPQLVALFQGEAEKVLGELPGVRRGAAPLARLNDYLREYGHQVYTFDFYFPTLAERRDLLVHLLQSYLGQQRPDSFKELALQARDRRRAQTNALRLMRQTAPDQVDAFQKLLRWHQLCARLREDITFYFQLGWPLMRAAVLELGRRLAQSGAIEREEQIFFLEKAEVQDAASRLDSSGQFQQGLAQMAKERQQTWDKHRRLSPPPPNTASGGPCLGEPFPAPVGRLRTGTG